MIKIKKILQKPYPKDYNLLSVQGLLQARYQTFLSIILSKEFIKLNLNTRHDDKKSETCEIKYKDCDCFLETNLKQIFFTRIQVFYVATRIILKSLMKT